MKKFPIIVAGTLLSAFHLCAQIVNDSASLTLSNQTNTFTGDVTVGTNGSFTLFVLAGNALLTNSANGIIGRNVTARSNAFHLVSPTARWHMGGNLFVGSNGSSSTLIVSNGAHVRANAGFIGRLPASGSNVALVTGVGSMWSNVAGGVGLTMGNGSGNQLIVSNGGWVVNANGSATIGSNGSNNLARVTGPGSVWSNRFALDIKSIGAGNVHNGLVIEDGGQVFNTDGTIDGLSGGGNNLALITGSGAVWNNSVDLYVGPNARGSLVVSNGGTVLSVNGYVGQNSNQVWITGSDSRWSNRNDVVLLRGNTLAVTNGGWLINSNGYLGGLTPGDLSSSNNTVVVTGAGSTWTNRADLFLGFAGRGNQLVVSNGATVAANNLFIGFHPNSLDNRLIVDGGALRVTNLTGNGKLDVRRGTNVLNAGLIEVDQLLLTNSASRYEFNGGTLSTRSAIVNNGQLFRVGNGISPATLFLAGDGSHSFGGLTITANAALTGNGTVSGASVLPGGTLSPGTSIGILRFTSTPLLQGAILMEISKNGAALTNDQIHLQVVNLLTYGGALTVTNIGPTALAVGDRFVLFASEFYTGNFGTIFLPPLPAGLRWMTNLLVDGSIEVESLAPSVTTLPATALSQTSATLNGVANPKGTDTTAWFEFGFSTNYGNVTPPQALGSGNGDTNFSEAMVGLIPGVSYHFRAVASNSFGVTFGTDESFPSFAQRDYIKASNTGTNDRFGSAIAMDGDTLIVGAEFEASFASGVNGDQNINSVNGFGAVYVFVRSGNSWVQQAYLKASNPGSSDNFGQSVAVSGDTVVVGADGEASNATGINGNQSNNSASAAGAAYVFVRSGTNWSQQAYLKASNTEQFDFFGSSVAISGDTVVVGAYAEDSNATGANGNQSDNSAPGSGAVYVFVRNGSTWTQQAYLQASNPVQGDGFGASVAMSGDTVAVGAPFKDDSAFQDGAAYVFVRSGTTWTEQAYLKASNAGVVDDFGSSVAVSGDTIVVSAPNEDSSAAGVNGDQNNNNASDSGAAYVFVRNGATWSQQAYLKASNTGSSDLFGTSVALSSDTVVVGARGEDSNATGVNGDGANNLAPSGGAAYLFVRTGTTWTFDGYLKASNTESNDFFGVSVAVSGDLVAVGADSESGNAIAVNGDQNNNGVPFSGAAYVFGPPLPPSPEINVSQSGTNIVNGGAGQAYLVAGTNTQSRSFTIKNTGNDFLTGLTITFDGPDAAKFSVTVNPVAPLIPTSNTTFTVRFAPTSTGTNTATLHIASNDADENPFNIQLNGLSLSFTEDRDGDGLNDASELLMASLGFNLQVSQTSLVNTLFNNVGGAVSNLNSAGFFTQSQLQALNVNSPLLAHDPFTGLFTLTIGVEKATQLTNFFPFPMSTPQTVINAEGKLEFQFSAPDNAAFFRLEAR